MQKLFGEEGEHDFAAIDKLIGLDRLESRFPWIQDRHPVVGVVDRMGSLAKATG